MTAIKGTMKFAALILIATFPVAAVAADMATVPRNVLILHSNQRPTPAQVVIEDTLRTVVPAGYTRPVQLFSEYLDDEWASIQTYGAAEAQFLRDKYSQRNIRVIVADALPALQFVSQYRDRIFPGVPVVHIAVARDRLESVALSADIAGNTENQDPTPTLQLALRLHPGATRLVVVRGASERDRLWDARVRAAIERVGNGLEVEYLSALTTAEVMRRVGALPKGTLVFTPGYFVDGAGEVSTPRQSVERIARASPVPVYGAFDTLLGAGIVGGYMTRFEDQAKEAGAIVVQLLNGTTAAKIEPASVTRVPMVDWRQLQRWRVDESALPPDAVVLFREPGLWSRYRWEIVAVAVAFILQSLLIATLFVQRRRRQRAERAELQQRVALAHSLRLATIGEMTASISHEINQPLGAILSNADAAEMLLDSESPSPIQLREILADIRRDDLRASEVVQRIRSLLQKHDVEKEIHDVNHLVSETMQLIAAEAVHRQMDIEVQLAPLPLRVHGDRVQLQQLLLNLVLNAMDAMAHTPVVFRRVTVRVSRRDNRKIEIAVSDAGHGIETGASERMFDSFFTTKPNGLGLGLSIVRTIAEAHGGSVRAENNPSVGATFRVTLPEADGPESNKNEAAKADTR